MTKRRQRQVCRSTPSTLRVAVVCFLFAVSEHAPPGGVAAFSISAPPNTVVPESSSKTAVSDEDLDRLTKLCYASSLSYLPMESMHYSDYSATLPDLKPLVQVVEPQTESGATIFESKNDDTLIVACRGSATPKNFATNLRFRLKPMNNRFDTEAKAHEGFQEAAEGLWERLEPHLTGGSTAANKKKVVFTGHSLGAGTAEICALHAVSASQSGSSTLVSDVTTFGGGMIGDSQFAHFVNEQALADTIVRHVVHGADPILANNEPLWKQLGFKRSGEVLRCDPHAPKVLRHDEEDFRVRNVPWNILDHCKYLGIFLGPRLAKKNKD